MNGNFLVIFLVAVIHVSVCRDVPTAQQQSEKKSSVRKRPSLAAPGGDLISSSTSQTDRSSTNSTIVVLVVSPSNNATHIRQTVAGDRRGPVETAPQRKQRLIRGSKKAATITKKEYLKKDWCKTEPFQQVVHEHGCIHKKIMNRFCYGQCNSFFIPKSDEEDQDGGSFRSCAYCMPIDSEWVDIVLHCPKKNPPRITKRIQIVSQCKCMAVNLESGGILDAPQ